MLRDHGQISQYVRAIVAGSLVWTMVLSTFFILENTAVTRESVAMHGWIAIALTPAYAVTGVWLFFRKEPGLNGVVTGIIMTLTALTLDALITVPLIEMPKGGSYQSFFGSVILWALAAANMMSVLIYSKFSGAAT